MSHTSSLENCIPSPKNQQFGAHGRQELEVKAKVKADKMVHKIMVLATKPEDLSSIPRIYIQILQDDLISTRVPRWKVRDVEKHEENPFGSTMFPLNRE